MGKLMVVVTRFLLFCTVLLTLPAVTAAQSTPLADISPTAILYNSADLVPGKTVFFDSGIQNSGSQGTGVFNIRWFVDDVSVGYGSHAGVPANSTVLDGNSQYSWPATSGTHTISFVVDSDNHVLESNESNNSRSVTIMVADQSVTPEEKIIALEESGAIPKLDRSTDVAGTDTNGNGVRDDVEAFIASNYTKEVQRVAAMQFASAIQAAVLVDSSNNAAVKQTAIRIARAANCINTKFDPAAGDKHSAAVGLELESITTILSRGCLHIWRLIRH